MAENAKPLLGGDTGGALSFRAKVHEFMEARTVWGRIYEGFTILLIVVNVVAFIFASCFVQEYAGENSFGLNRESVQRLDLLFFGNDSGNALAGTSVLEIVTVAIFTLDYIIRFWAVGEEGKIGAQEVSG